MQTGQSKTRHILLVTIAVFTAVLLGWVFFSTDDLSRAAQVSPAGKHEKHTDHHFEIGLTCPFAPFFERNDNVVGLEWRLLEKAFADINLIAQPIFLNYNEAMNAFELGLIQGVWLCGGMKRPDNGVFISTSLLPRNFVAVTLEERGITVDSIGDLSMLRTGIHPDLFVALDKDSSLALLSNPDLRHVSNHVLLEALLFAGEIDAIISEQRVFEYYRREVPALAKPDQKVTIHPVFPPVRPVIAFKEKDIRDRFNASWKALGGETVQ